MLNGRRRCCNCDVVVTDKAVAATVNQAGLTGRLGTVVLSRLSDLFDHL